MFLYDLKKKQTTRLTKSEDTEISPRFRPQHQEVVFARELTRTTHIWLQDLATGKERELTQGPGHDSVIDLSPNGKYLLFSHYLPAETAKEEVHLLDIESGKATNFPKDFAGAFRGIGETLIGWQYVDGDYSMVEVNLNGTVSKNYGKGSLVQTMDSEGVQAVVRVVGKETVVYEINSDLALWNLKTGARESIGKGHSPCLFANGKVLFFTGYERDAWIWQHGQAQRKIDSPSAGAVDQVPSQTVGNRAAVFSFCKSNEREEKPYVFNAETEKFEAIEWTEPAKDAK